MKRSRFSEEQIIATLIENCRISGIEPQAYIANVIEKVAGEWPASRWDEFMPWNWKTDEQPLIAKSGACE